MEDQQQLVYEIRQVPQVSGALLELRIVTRVPYIGLADRDVAHAVLDAALDRLNIEHGIGAT